MQTSYEIERKFLALDADLRDLDLALVDITSVYLDPKSVSDLADELGSSIDHLKKSNVELRVSKKVFNDKTSYWYTVKTGGHDLVRGEVETPISESIYNTVSKKFGISSVDKKRFVFDYLRKIFELDIFVDHELMLLEVELKHPKELVALPPFVTIAKEVTGNPSYYGFQLATKLNP